jgi:hypothetical protein
MKNPFVWNEDRFKFFVSYYFVLWSPYLIAKVIQNTGRLSDW